MSIQGGAFVRAAKRHDAEGLGCEDAAWVELRGSKAFAVVCDGCSSGEDSGLTAKALARAASAAWLAGVPIGPALGQAAWMRASGALAGLGVDASRGPATLLAMEVEQSEDGSSALAKFALWGDGVAGWRSGSGQAGGWEGKSVENRPCYPAYAFNELLWEAHQAAGGSACSWEPLEMGQGALSIAAGWRCSEGSAILGDGDCVALLSDGALAIEGVGIGEALSELLRGSGPGSFVQRRARSAIESWIKNGARLGDDFGMACLRWTRGEE